MTYLVIANKKAKIVKVVLSGLPVSLIQYIQMIEPSVYLACTPSFTEAQSIASNKAIELGYCYTVSPEY